MGKLVEFLKRIGVVEGMTFRCVQQEGVGMFIVPNPNPNRMNPHAVEAPSNRRPVRRAAGDWTAKPYHKV